MARGGKCQETVLVGGVMAGLPCLGGPKAWQLIFPPKLWVCVSQSPSSSRPSTPKSDSELVSKSVDRTLQKSNLEMLWLWGELPQAAKVSPSLALPHTMLGPSAPAWAMHSQASMPGAWHGQPGPGVCMVTCWCLANSSAVPGIYVVHANQMWIRQNAICGQIGCLETLNQRASWRSLGRSQGWESRTWVL